MHEVDSCDHVEKWLIACLPTGGVQLSGAHNIKRGPEREVWDCQFTLNDTVSAAILTVFRPGTRESVNTSLLPQQAAKKCALAMTELPAYGIPTPRVLGEAVVNGEASVLCERVERVNWRPEVRIEAARVLSRIHSLEASSLSEALRTLTRASDPREYRTTGGEAPISKTKALVHGDYFSANVLPVVNGLRVIDWETFGWGDPMWDLGFLVGADRDLTMGEVEQTIAAYQENAPVEEEQLNWHRQSWSAYWKERDEGSSNKSGGGDGEDRAPHP